MNITLSKNNEWLNIAIQASIAASEAISEIYLTDFEVEKKADHSPVTIADKTSSKIILSHLKKTGIPIISEEETIPPYETRKKAEYIWIVDPLDGTKEFIRKNGEFCVCIALIHQHQPVFGIIAAPQQHKVIYGGNQTGVFFSDFKKALKWEENNRLNPPLANQQKTIAYSRSHFSKKAMVFINAMEKQFGELNYIRKGSALKFIDLALGAADIYPRLAPTMEWDIAAGQAIFEALGGEVLDFTNFEPLHYNKEDLYNPFFVAKHGNLSITP